MGYFRELPDIAYQSPLSHRNSSGDYVIIKNIPKKIEKNLDVWVAGCDVCQDVCPWNKSVPYNNNFETKPKEWIKNLDVASIDLDQAKEIYKANTSKK